MRKIALFFQYALPHRFLSRLIYYIMRIRVGFIKNFIIKRMVSAFSIRLDEAESEDLNHYPHFNAFFTRALKPGIRPIDAEPQHIVSPVDGAISQAGPITDGRIVQAKGHSYTVAELLAVEQAPQALLNGHFMTIYLSPKDYHRIHAPVDCRLQEMHHVPGRLFSVADWTAQSIPRLFARNERLVNALATDMGTVYSVYVGAILVSSIETVKQGLITPPYTNKVREVPMEAEESFVKGDEMARFNMGSTVILLFPENSIELAEHIKPGVSVKLGEKIAVKKA